MMPLLRYLQRKACRIRAAAGFTLIETFVAITILVTAIVGPLTIAAQGLYSAIVAADQTSAIFLTQDAIEYIRWVRDTNTLGGQGWLTNLAPCLSTDGSRSCYFDSTKPPAQIGNITQCSGACPLLSYDTQTGFYNYGLQTSTNAPTKFTRTITITSPVCNGGGTLCNANEVTLSASVTWQSGSLTHSFIVRENLLKWH